MSHKQCMDVAILVHTAEYLQDVAHYSKHNIASFGPAFSAISQKSCSQIRLQDEALRGEMMRLF